MTTAIFRWSVTDGGYAGETRNFSPSYRPPVGLGLWVPTPRRLGPDVVAPKPQSALQPTWGGNRMLVPSDTGSDCDPPTVGR